LGLPTDDVVALIQCRKEHGVEVDRPDPVVGLLEADVAVGERIREIQQLAAEAKRTAFRALRLHAREDATDAAVIGVHTRGTNALWARAAQRAIIRPSLTAAPSRMKRFDRQP
jgi:hypothetical protein